MPSRSPTNHDSASQSGRSASLTSSRPEAVELSHDPYTEAEIRLEQNRDWYQASSKWSGIDLDTVVDVAVDSAGVLLVDEANFDLGEALAQIERVHRPTQSSSATPWERWLTVGGVSEPFPPYARQALSDSGITPGSMEGLSARSLSARTIDRERRHAHVNAEPRVQSAPAGGQHRVQKDVRKIRRSTTKPQKRAASPSEREE